MSPDDHFIIKSAKKKEAKLLLSVLDRYIEHFRSSDGSSKAELSLLPRYLGLYAVYVKVGQVVRKRYLLVMNNWFAAHCQIHKRFDLKGSTFNRKSDPQEHQKGNKAVFKDLDFLASSHDLPLNQAKSDLLSTLERDVKLMSDLDLIDYSLLVGIHNKTANTECPMRLSSDLLTIETEQHVFYIGIIDVLTEFTLKK